MTPPELFGMRAYREKEIPWREPVKRQREVDEILSTSGWNDVKIYSREWYARHGVKCIDIKSQKEREP